MNHTKKWLLFCLTFSVAFLLLVSAGSRTVTVISENMPVLRQHTLILDAGHGGVDGGTTSCTGRLESSYNLEITQRLRDMLEFLGYNTRLVRDSDISVYTKGETIAQKKASDLKERVRIVNETDNALLLSIHQNHFSDSQYSGAQVFYPNTPGSEVLAKNIQASFVTYLNPGSRRQVKRSQGIYLMEHIHCTGVLIECGFLSNPEEENALSQKTYQQKLCAIIAAATAQFLSNT